MTDTTEQQIQQSEGQEATITSPPQPEAVPQGKAERVRQLVAEHEGTATPEAPQEQEPAAPKPSDLWEARKQTDRQVRARREQEQQQAVPPQQPDLATLVQDPKALLAELAKHNLSVEDLLLADVPEPPPEEPQEFDPEAYKEQLRKEVLEEMNKGLSSYKEAEAEQQMVFGVTNIAQSDRSRWALLTANQNATRDVAGAFKELVSRGDVTHENKEEILHGLMDLMENRMRERAKQEYEFYAPLFQEKSTKTNEAMTEEPKAKTAPRRTLSNLSAESDGTERMNKKQRVAALKKEFGG